MIRKSSLKWLRSKLARTWLARWLRLCVNYRLRIRPNLKSQLRLESNSQPWAEKKRIKVLCPLIETSHYRFYHYLIFAKALELRGAEVKVILCGSSLPGCELKSVKSNKIDPCMTCRFNHQRVIPLYGLDTVTIDDLVPSLTVEQITAKAHEITSDFPARFLYHGIDIIPTVKDSVVRYFYGATPNEDSAEMIRVQRDHLISSMMNIEVSRQLEANYNPDVVLAYMTAYSAWSPYQLWFESQNTPVVSITSTQYDYSAVNVNVNQLYFSKERFNKYRRSRKNRVLSNDEKQVLKKILDERFSGQSQVFDHLGFFDNRSEMIDTLDIDRNKRNIFLFSNVYWDIGISEFAQLFEGVIDWVIKTIEYVEDHDSCHLYIKPHPGEEFDSAPSLKGVMKYVHERYPELPRNVSFISPKMKIKPYDLAPFADLAVVYSGTLGLEMMLHGVPVVACGLSPFGGPGLATEPDNINEYRDALLGDIIIPDPDKEELDMFSYFYFVKLQIPWKLTRQVYADNFMGYLIKNIDDLQPGKDRYLDHLCDCVLHPNDTVAEAW
jgi:hypothetical protein